MPGTSTLIGPFKGGLNTINDPSAISDDELVELTNFDVDIDGSLKGRPPITPRDNTTGGIGRTLLLGMFPLPSGARIIGSSNNAIMLWNGIWNTVRTGTTSKTAVMYDNVVYIVSNNLGPSGTIVDSIYQDVLSIPKGDTAVAFKERLFIGVGKSPANIGVSGARLYYSDPGSVNFSTFPGINFIDIGPGDGEVITGLKVYNDNLVIFKNDSTWVLSYDTDPGSGTLRKISTSVGSSAPLCTAQYRNEIYTLHEGSVYELVNYNFTRINTRTPFVYDPSIDSPGAAALDPLFTCIIGDRLVCRYYNKVYVFSFITKVWAEWKSVIPYGPFIEDPIDITTNGYLTYYAGSYVSPSSVIWRIKDGHNDTDNESFECKIKTKIYSFADQGQFKRLFWWGADILTDEIIYGKVHPITQVSSRATWLDMGGRTWADMGTGTWAFPFGLNDSVDTDIFLTGNQLRRFLKFYKSLRFRLVQFELSFFSDGLIPAPRLFSLVAYIKAKEKVVQQVS